MKNWVRTIDYKDNQILIKKCIDDEEKEAIYVEFYTDYFLCSQIITLGNPVGQTTAFNSDSFITNVYEDTMKKIINKFEPHKEGEVKQ